jgi:kynurenine formamidase
MPCADDRIQLPGEETMKDASNGRRRFVATAGFAAIAGALGQALVGREVRADDDHDVDKFIKAVQKARIFDLSHTWDEKSPIAGVNPPYEMTLNKTHDDFDPTKPPDQLGTRGQFDPDRQLSFTSEIQKWSGQHGAPSIDAIGHIGHNGWLFGKVDAKAATSNRLGIGRSGVGANLDIAHYPTNLLVNRGVLLDVGRFLQHGSAAPLPADTNITAEDLAETAHDQGVKIKRGDTVLIRTGWGQYFNTQQAKYSDPNASAGVGVSGAKYLIKQKAAVVGNDTLTFEFRPPVAFPPDVPLFQVFPVHMLVIADNGINIIENYFLEEIAAAKEYEFLLVVPPLKIRGGTGSALRSFALVP